ncbi:hypothetical protein JHK85_000690 [Glycine max]|nr:hypothetical protein JHK85_000690 [Glycine max]
MAKADRKHFRKQRWCWRDGFLCYDYRSQCEYNQTSIVKVYVREIMVRSANDIDGWWSMVAVGVFGSTVVLGGGGTCLGEAGGICVEDEVLPREEPSSARVKVDENVAYRRRCSSAGSSGRRFFRLIQRKNLLHLLPLEPVEEPFTFLSQELAEEHLIPQATFSARGRTCGTFFRRLSILLAEEPAKLLPQATFCCILVFFLENYV